jgi:hypothetical protein
MISAIGHEIERSLGIAQSNDLLSRWMAYRLAEIRQTIEASDDPVARNTALTEQDRLVMELWSRRSTLPRSLGVDQRIRPAARIVESLAAVRDPWNRTPRKLKKPAELVDTIAGSCRHLVALIAVLVYTNEAIELGPENPDLPLTQEEEDQRTQFKKLAQQVFQELQSSPIGLWSDQLPTSDRDAVAMLQKGIATAISEMKSDLIALQKSLL